MKAGIICLALGYVLSQFYRAFLAVMAPFLETDLGAGPEVLAFANGLWFLVFAAMQIPVGEALDRVGPRLTTSVLFALGGGGGAAVFAMASAPWHISLSMALIGLGCSPVLMANYYIFARAYAPAVFATMAGVTLGIGTFGNIASSLPLTLAVEALGWRGAMWILAGMTVAISVLVFVFVRDPARSENAAQGSVLDLLKMPVLWPIFAMMMVNYVPAAGLRGLWAGPYLEKVMDAPAATIGVVLLVMSVAMAAGNFIFGPLDRMIKSRKAIVLGGNLGGVIATMLLVWFADTSIVVSAILLACVGVFGATFVVIIAHAKDYFPEHLTGRGVTLLNLFGIGGVGIFQSLSSPIYANVAPTMSATGAHQVIFLFFGLSLLIGVIFYSFSKETPRDQG